MRTITLISLGACTISIAHGQTYVFDTFDTKINGTQLAPRNNSGQAAEGGSVGGNWYCGDTGTNSDPSPSWAVSQLRSNSGKQSVEAATSLSNSLTEASSEVDFAVGTKIGGSYAYSADLSVSSLSNAAAGITLGGFQAFMGQLYLQADGTVLAGNHGDTAYTSSGSQITWSGSGWRHLEIDVNYTNSTSGLYNITYRLDGALLYNGSGTLISSSNTSSNYVRALGLDITQDVFNANVQSADVYYDNVNLQSVPEPATISGLAIALGIFIRRRKK